MKLVVRVMNVDTNLEALLVERELERDEDEELDFIYETMDLGGWNVTDHRETTGELLLEATADNAYVSISIDGDNDGKG